MSHGHKSAVARSWRSPDPGSVPGSSSNCGRLSVCVQSVSEFFEPAQPVAPVQAPASPDDGSRVRTQHTTIQSEQSRAYVEGAALSRDLLSSGESNSRQEALGLLPSLTRRDCRRARLFAIFHTAGWLPLLAPPKSQPANALVSRHLTHERRCRTSCRPPQVQTGGDGSRTWVPRVITTLFEGGSPGFGKENAGARSMRGSSAAESNPPQARRPSRPTSRKLWRRSRQDASRMCRSTCQQSENMRSTPGGCVASPLSATFASVPG